MQGLATDRVSLSFLVPRNQSPFLRKHLKPTRACFSNLGSFPKSRISSQIVPLLANDFSSSSSFTHLFAHDRRLPRRLRASDVENSEAAEELRAKKLRDIDRRMNVLDRRANVYIAAKGAEHVADVLRYNNTISVLDLRANGLRDEGASCLARSLKVVNEALTSMDLGFNGLMGHSPLLKL